MRNAFRVLAALLTLLLTLLPGAAFAADTLVQGEAVSAMQGDVPALKAALREPSAVTYKLMLAGDCKGCHRTEYLDRVLDLQGWPQADELLLIIFPGANHDIRFAMGANFRKEGVSVGEMVALLHERYFPHVHKGDPAAGLASLIRAVNQRMSPTDIRAGARVMRQTVAAMQAGDWQALAAMVGERGLIVAPYRVGAPEEGLKGEAQELALQQMLEGASPNIIAYDLRHPGAARVAVEGLNPAGLITATAMFSLQQRADRTWGLAYIVIDGRGDLLKELKAEGFTLPFQWHTVVTGQMKGSSARWDRETPGTVKESMETESLLGARQFLGEEVHLPDALEGNPIGLYREYDALGRLLLSGAGQHQVGFVVRLRPLGDHRVRAEYGDVYDVKVESRTIAGRPARLIIVTNPQKGGSSAELWLEDGLWVYELRDEVGNVDRLIRLAESLK